LASLITGAHYVHHAMVQLIEALCYKPSMVEGSISEGVVEIFY